MNTTQLECFVNIASTLNFIKTAELMSLSQPAVSRQIQSLETELGARLINRTTRSVSLTDIGERFLPEAKDILQTFYHSKDMISSFSDNEQNYLRIGYSDPHAINRISHTLALMREKYSRLYPRFTLDQTDANLARLERSQLDLVIGIKDYSYENRDIMFMELMKERFVCIVRSDHPLLKDIGDSDTVITDQLRPYSQILAIPPYLIRNYFTTRHSILPVNNDVTNYTVSNSTEAYGMLLAGYGYCMVPSHLVIPHEDIRVLNWKQSHETSMGIYYRKGSLKDSPVILDYIKFAKDIYSL